MWIGESGLDMAEYLGEYKIIRRMDGGGNANVFTAENVKGDLEDKVKCVLELASLSESYL